MGLPSLFDYPQEVLLGISELLSQSELTNLSKACHALHSLIEPLLYPAFSFLWEREFHPPITELVLLIRTLLEKPDLCSLVLSLEFTGYGHKDEIGTCGGPDWTKPTPDPPPVVPMLPVDKLASAMERTGAHLPVINDWTVKVGSGDPEAAMAVLVSLLPNLKRLCVSENWNEITPFLEVLFDRSVCSPRQRSSQCSISSCEFLEYMRNEDNMWPYNGEDRGISGNTTAAPSLLYLPNIQHLEISIDNLMTFSWPCSPFLNPDS
ncbi:hypothetical protein AU210_016322 [Fusarium oxysporum f. sp. radicis-cucumerinum]|uniref:F-box domain-containing protein n=1 Tax=Fusarium oxysporum f. sp. radicis-cucumerinum TaxID=327505 RepID=A0A2H3FRH2_FUSOX|nr:hypothetical protein AU210_016322 [Fusarium oxysporum f. sp. radicis-cucumerinum]